ncbi:ATP-binding protein [Streptomyces sp. NPDC060031]|uniref:ATP-binding protein n=1 Tax=Streptomyces sp. NPDC060031 TaxID=3347043 RepID=UPI0036942D71
MSIAALPDADLRLVGVPHPLPVLDCSEVNFQRTGLPEKDRQRPRQARRIVMACMGVWGLRDLADDTALLLSELVSNAVVHGAGEAVRVRLFLTEEYVCLEVRGGGSGVPRVQAADHLDENGRGLFLVDAMADAWGVTEKGACVWCVVGWDAQQAEGST